MKFIYGHTSPETAYIVNDYPYGFRLRTQIRYWIDTTKHGDRFCSQTLNPKTNIWNKPKKDTYSEIEIMVILDNRYVKRVGFTHWENEEKLNAWLENKDQTQFNPMQVEQIKRLRAIFRTREHLTFEVTNVTYMTPEERAEHDKEQEEVKGRINKVFAYEYSKA